MSYAAAPPRPRTVSVTVSGPSTVLAYAKALLLKLARLVTTSVRGVRTGLRAALSMPRAVADAALAALSTDRGYEAAVRGIGTAVRAIGRAVSTTLRAGGGLVGWFGRRAARLVHVVSPWAGARLERGIATITRAADRVMTRIEEIATDATQLVGMLARTPLVRAVTTRVAAVASGLLGVHLLTQGALAARLVQAIPQAVTAVAWLTNPWLLLAGVALAFAGVTVFAGVRLMTTTQPGSPDPAPAASSAPAAMDQAFQAIVSQLHVAVEPDGSVRVDGIPADLPENVQQEMASTAANAAAGQLQRLARRGRPITSADRRSVAKAARAAVFAWLSSSLAAVA